jgi:glycosyltransferase involved in cell wall biosynthesis
MPVYNRAHLVAKTIDSVLAQEFEDFELILIDDKSSDDSLNILLEAAKKDKRISIVSLAENQGRCRARNAGLLKSTGDWLCFLDSDDAYFHNHLTIMYRAILANPAQDAFATLQLMGDIETSYKTDYLTIEDAVVGNPVQLNQLCYKRELECYFVDENLPISEDWLFLRELLLKTNIKILKTLTCQLIEHEHRSMKTTEVERIAYFNNYSTDLFLERNKVPNPLKNSLLSNNKLLAANMLLSRGIKGESKIYLLAALKYLKTYVNPLLYKALIKLVLPKEKLQKVGFK